MRKYRDLKVWQRTMTFTVEHYREIYILNQLLPENEPPDTGNQTPRVAPAVALNFAEASGNAANKEFIRFLQSAFFSNHLNSVFWNLYSGVWNLKSKPEVSL